MMRLQRVVHQPIRNVAPNGRVFGKTGKTVGVDTLSPSNKDIKQLYEYLNNGKYHKQETNYDSRAINFF